MDNTQHTVNRLAKNLRLQVIEALFKEDRLKYEGKRPTDDEMFYMVNAVDRLPCCTALLRRLFNDAHEMHEEKGMFPHAVCVGDLEWCIKNRTIGYGVTQSSVPNAWLPLKQDVELRRLPAFLELARIYRPMIEAGKRILPPIDQEKIENEALAIVNGLADKLKGEI